MYKITNLEENMEAFIALIGIVGTLSIIIGIIMLFKKVWRKNGLKILIGGIIFFVIGVIFSPAKDNQAVKMGFESYSDQQKAKDHNISDASEWKAKKADILEQERVQKETADKAEADKKQKELAKQNAVNQFYAIPSDEQRFIDIVQKASADYSNAENDIKKGGIRNDRSKAVCKVVSSPLVKNWVGTITELTTNSDGLGVLSVRLDKNVTVTTWNNALSDTFDNTLIHQDSPVFKILSELQKGSKIKFSGTFFRDDEGVDCYRESSLTMSGAMTDPEYLFRFSSVSVFKEIQ